MVGGVLLFFFGLGINQDTKLPEDPDVYMIVLGMFVALVGYVIEYMREFKHKAKMYDDKSAKEPKNPKKKKAKKKKSKKKGDDDVHGDEGDGFGGAEEEEESEEDKKEDEGPEEGSEGKEGKEDKEGEKEGGVMDTETDIKRVEKEVDEVLKDL